MGTLFWIIAGVAGVIYILGAGLMFLTGNFHMMFTWPWDLAKEVYENREELWN